MESLGEIKHIEINGNICYVLYLNYFSAILAYEIFNEIITKEEKNIAIRLIKNDNNEKDKENLEKQKNEFSELANKYLDFSKWNMSEFEKENSEFFCSKSDFGNKNFTKKGKIILV
jgi:hypothetical protein